MFNGIGPTGFILIILVALLLFGPNKLPELGRAFGRTLREFKEGAKDLVEHDDSDRKPRKEVRGEESKPQESQAAKDQDNNRRLPD